MLDNLFSKKYNSTEKIHFLEKEYGIAMTEPEEKEVIEDAQRATTDRSYCEQLLKEYSLA